MTGFNGYGCQDIGELGNKTANQCAKKGSGHPFIGPQLTCCILERAAKWAIRDWMHRSPHLNKNMLRVFFKNQPPH
jgi:hypothetical protein